MEGTYWVGDHAVEGDRGRPIGGLPLVLLEALYRADGEFVSREQLKDDLWQSRAGVSEAALDAHIYVLRKALRKAQGSDDPDPVEVVRGRGARLRKGLVRHGAGGDRASTDDGSGRIAIDELAASRRWEYQWEDGLNAINERAVEPPLPRRIALELSHRARTEAEPALFFVRGELGIGKSTLAEMLLTVLPEIAVGEHDLRVQNALLQCAVLEAGDLESAEDFARRVNTELSGWRPVVALARPGTLDAAEQWIARTPQAAVTMRTFEPGSIAFRQCLRDVGVARRLGADAQRRLAELASRLPSFLCTPFYFHEIANVLGSSPATTDNADLSPLELVRRSLERRIRRPGSFQDLIDCAYQRKAPGDLQAIAGVLEATGFRHDGYRNVVLAAAVIQGAEAFRSLVVLPNAVPAVRIILDHIEYAWRRRRSDRPDALMASLRDFVLHDLDSTLVPYAIFLQALVAASFRKLGDPELASVLQGRCLSLIQARSDIVDEAPSSETLWWDVSDALSLVGDPRLLSARRERYSAASGYFTYFARDDVEIGSEFIPERVDNAKPVQPYRRQVVTVGPLWVSNFLVTNEEFAEFWTDPHRDRAFRFTGAQWLADDARLMGAIASAFEVAARRCFWKETSEAATVASGSSSAVSILDLARERALRRSRIRLWDPTQADDRFSASGNPVVGVTWWEAIAYCEWWTSSRLEGAGFPPGSRASLLTDWEWEAVRRRYYESSDSLVDGRVIPPNRYPAHLRRSASRVTRNGRVNNVMRPLHVGLSNVPQGGPFDMVGNVWEWTRSRVFGRIVETPDGNGEFGNTAWDDGEVEAERGAIHPERDRIDALDDLTYRALRGGSFFSIDEQAAWHPAYRLCDPPFSSYFDLGFRIAVYPPEGWE